MPLPYQYEAAVSMIQGYQDLPRDGFPKIMHFFYYLFVVLPVKLLSVILKLQIVTSNFGIQNRVISKRKHYGKSK